VDLELSGDPYGLGRDRASLDGGPGSLRCLTKLIAIAEAISADRLAAITSSRLTIKTANIASLASVTAN
jgi:hypothetical protein